MITFQCDSGFSPAAEMTATCNSSGQWTTDPSQLVCTGSNGEERRMKNCIHIISSNNVCFLVAIALSTES